MAVLGMEFDWVPGDRVSPVIHGDFRAALLIQSDIDVRAGQRPIAADVNRCALGNFDHAKRVGDRSESLRGDTGYGACRDPGRRDKGLDVEVRTHAPLLCRFPLNSTASHWCGQCVTYTLFRLLQNIALLVLRMLKNAGPMGATGGDNAFGLPLSPPSTAFTQ